MSDQIPDDIRRVIEGITSAPVSYGRSNLIRDFTAALVAERKRCISVAREQVDRINGMANPAYGVSADIQKWVAGGIAAAEHIARDIEAGAPMPARWEGAKLVGPSLPGNKPILAVTVMNSSVVACTEDGAYILDGGSWRKLS